VYNGTDIKQIGSNANISDVCSGSDGFHGFPQFLEAHAWIVHQIRPRLFSSIYLPIHYPPILSLDAVWAADGKGKVVPVLSKLSTIPQRRMENGSIDPRFLDHGTRWKWVANFTPLPLYPLDRRLGEPQNRSGRCEEKNIAKSNPGRPASSPFVHLLSYITILSMVVRINNIYFPQVP
jgi:hypothetical protein